MTKIKKEAGLRFSILWGNVQGLADNEFSQPRSGIPRRRTIYWRTADVSAWGGHRRAIGRYIGGAGIHAPPTTWPVLVVKVHYRACRRGAIMEIKKLPRVLPHPGRDESRGYTHPYAVVFC